MNLWQRIQEWFTSSKNRFKTPVFEPDRVDQPYDDDPIAENTSYCRIWLDRMRLAKNVEWIKERYPIVHAAIGYEYGGKTVTVPQIAGVDFFQKMTQDNLDRVLTQSVPLSPLFPYKTGLVKVQAGLFSMKASDLIGSAVKTLSRFSQMLGVPALSQVLDIVDPLYSGIEDLFDVGDSRLELGYQQNFAPDGKKGPNTFRPGYFAVIYDPDGKVREEELRIVGGDIHRLADGPAKPQLLTGFSYMLLRIEKRPSQDWESLGPIKELVERAQNAILAKKSQEAQEILAAIKVAIARSHDVVRSDRPVMFAKIEADLRDLGLQARVEEISKPSLHAIMQREVPAPTADELAAWDRLVEVLTPAGR
jgi:hypothetical protein